MNWKTGDPLRQRPAVALLALLCAGWMLAPAGAAASPLLSEVFYDAVGSDDGQGFVEIYGVAGSSLDGLVVEGVNGANGAAGPSLALSGVIPADGLFVLADGDGGGVTAVPGADLILDFDFQNGPDSIVLRSDSAVLDAVGYGDFDPGEVFAGEGTPAPDAPSGSSLARAFADVDSDDNASDWLVLATPTPGTAPVLGLPEAGTAWLLATPLLGLARRRFHSLPARR